MTRDFSALLASCPFSVELPPWFFSGEEVVSFVTAECLFLWDIPVQLYYCIGFARRGFGSQGGCRAWVTLSGLRCRFQTVAVWRQSGAFPTFGHQKGLWWAHRGWSCSITLTSSTGQGEKNTMKGSWVEITTGTSLTSYCCRQNRLDLGKLI